MTEHHGTVAWFNHRKGFGFITDEDGGDIFCHYSAIETKGYRTLDAGEAVSFELGPDKQGKSQAVHVVRTRQKKLAAAAE